MTLSNSLALGGARAFDRCKLTALVLFFAAGMAACALPRAEAPMLLRLAPSSLGREIAVVQRVQVQGGGKALSLDVALEVDSASVHMAVMELGLTVARLKWDGRHMTQSTVPGWPDAVSAERVLHDMQLVWWPADVVRAALPEGWSLEETPLARTLRLRGRAVTIVRAVAPGHIEVQQPAQGYTVQIYSQGDAPVFAAP